MKQETPMPKRYEYIIFGILLILMILFSCVNGQAQECKCEIETWNYEELDSMFRAEQLRIMYIQKTMIEGVNLKRDLDCSRIKLKAIENRKKIAKKKLIKT